MIQIYRVAHYLILEAANHYSLTDVQQKLAQEIESSGELLVTLILDIRASLATPSSDEIRSFGEYLSSISSQLSGGVYLTGDPLRFGLSNMVVANAGLKDSIGRVQIG